MNKRLIAIILVVFVALGAYGSYYVYATTYLMPEDIKILKDEIKTFNESGSYDDDISRLEMQANIIENASSLKLMSLSERKKQADVVENGEGMQSINSTLNKIRNNIANSEEMAIRYNLLLMGDVSSSIKSTYSEEIVNTLNSMGPLMTKLSQDITNGDNKAIANDLRELANMLRTFDKEEQASVTNLQDVVNKLEATKPVISF